MIFAIALRLAADAIQIAAVLALNERLRDGLGNVLSDALATNEQEIAQALVYVGTAATVEVLHRVWLRLKAGGDLG